LELIFTASFKKHTQILFFSRHLVSTPIDQLLSSNKHADCKHDEDVQVLYDGRKGYQKLCNWMRWEKGAKTYRRMEHGGKKEELDPEVVDVCDWTKSGEIGRKRSRIEQEKGHKDR